MELSKVCYVGYVVIPWSYASLPSNPGGRFELKRLIISVHLHNMVTEVFSQLCAIFDPLWVVK